MKISSAAALLCAAAVYRYNMMLFARRDVFLEMRVSLLMGTRARLCSVFLYTYARCSFISLNMAVSKRALDVLVWVFSSLIRFCNSRVLTIFNGNILLNSETDVYIQQV